MATTKKRVKWKQEACNLARCVVFALKFMKTSSPAGLMYETKTGKIKVWQHDFMDALDKIGYVVDRKKYFERKVGKTKKR